MTQINVSPDDRRSPGETTREVKKALNAAFPATKFTVSSHHSQVRIEWPDGPTIAQAEEALIRAGAQVEPNGPVHRFIKLHGRTLHCWAFNTAEREAQKQDIERRLREAEERRQRESEALAVARQAKDALLAGPQAERQAARAAR